MTNETIKTARDFFPKPSKDWHNIFLATIDQPTSYIFETLLDHFGLRASVEHQVFAETDDARAGADAATGEKDTATVYDSILDLVSFENIRALSNPNAPIRIAPCLTLFYGRNSSGKSSIAQSLRVFANARGLKTPPGYAHSDKSQDRYNHPRTASLNVVKKSDYDAHPAGTHLNVKKIEWQSGLAPTSELDARIIDRDVIATKVATTTFDSEFGLGIETFNRAREALKQIEQGLNRAASTIEATVVRLLGTYQSTLFEQALEILRESKFTAIDENVFDIKANELVHLIEQTKQATQSQSALIKSVESIRSKQAALSRLTAENDIKATLIADLIRINELRSVKSSGLTEIIKQQGLKIVHQQEWEAFLEAAELFVDTEYGERPYPTDKDFCMYCGQSFAEQATRDFIHSIRIRLQSNINKEEIDASARVRQARDDIFILRGYEGIPDLADQQSLDHTVLNSLNINASTLSAQLASELDKQQSLLASATDAEHARMVLEECKRELVLVQAKLFAIRNESVIREWDARRGDSKWLRQRSKEVNNYSVLWARQRTEAIKELSLKSYKDLFDNECKDLGLPFLLGITAATDSVTGKVARKTHARGKEPGEVLSESENSIWVLSDLLAELQLTRKSSVLILDDPVTSMDVERSGRLAERIVKEAQLRQIIILTHNRQFFYSLREQVRAYLKDKAFAVKAYVVERWRDTTGLVSEVNLFKSDEVCLFEKVTSIVENEHSDEHDVAGGFLLLRRLLENCIDQDILKGFRSRLQPEANNISWKNLRDIVIDRDLITDIEHMHGRISNLGALHLTAAVALATPTRQDLSTALEEVRQLCQRAKLRPATEAGLEADITPAEEVLKSDPFLTKEAAT